MIYDERFETMVWEKVTESYWAFVTEHERGGLWPWSARHIEYEWKVCLYRDHESKPFETNYGVATTKEAAIEAASFVSVHKSRAWWQSGRLVIVRKR